MESPQTFIEEIEYSALEFGEVVGKGAFGVVSRAKWRNKDVAVKLIETESERKAFRTELKQLSRVSHANIVRLYGASTKSPVCLVMEYAEGGSLYNVLHGTGAQPAYTTSHAISWCLQCALGVEYLHNMKPKALIHRDLKPPNLLLILGGTVLKICDFGTACDQQTHMTNNKGSAAWMAPEVFEGCNYTEKCDVFSFGIILWEVLTRRKPFDEIGGPAFRIMWAVHSGTRPPPIRNLPSPLEKLMTCCWSCITMERPSMSEVVRVMRGFMTYFEGSNEPIVYPASYVHDEDQEDSDLSEEAPMTSTMTGLVQPNKPTGYNASISDTVRQALHHHNIVTRNNQPVVIEEDFRSNLKSAPASLAASRESLLDNRGSRSGTPIADSHKRYSADLSKLDETDIMNQPVSQHTLNRRLSHRRSGSYGTVARVTTTNQSPTRTPHQAGLGHRRGGSDEYSRIMIDPSVLPSSHPPYGPHAGEQHLVTNRSTSWTPGIPVNFVSEQVPNLETLNAVLDNQLQPIAPLPSSAESLQIFEEHCRVAEDYLRVQIEIQLLLQRKQELLSRCEQDEQSEQNNYKMTDEYNKLKLENENLLLWHSDLKRQQRVRAQQSVT